MILSYDDIERLMSNLAPAQRRMLLKMPWVKRMSVLEGINRRLLYLRRRSYVWSYLPDRTLDITQIKVKHWLIPVSTDPPARPQGGAGGAS